MSKGSQQDVKRQEDTADSVKTMAGSGVGGTACYNTGTYADLRVKSFYIREDPTVITSLVCSNGIASENKSIADFYKGTTTPLKGDLHNGGEGYYFTDIVIASGSINTSS